MGSAHPQAARRQRQAARRPPTYRTVAPGLREAGKTGCRCRTPRAEARPASGNGPRRNAQGKVGDAFKLPVTADPTILLEAEAAQAAAAEPIPTPVSTRNGPARPSRRWTTTATDTVRSPRSNCHGCRVEAGRQHDPGRDRRKARGNRTRRRSTDDETRRPLDAARFQGLGTIPSGSTRRAECAHRQDTGGPTARRPGRRSQCRRRGRHRTGDPEGRQIRSADRACTRSGDRVGRPDAWRQDAGRHPAGTPARRLPCLDPAAATTPFLRRQRRPRRAPRTDRRALGKTVQVIEQPVPGPCPEGRQSTAPSRRLTGERRWRPNHREIRHAAGLDRRRSENATDCKQPRT